MNHFPDGVFTPSPTNPAEEQFFKKAVQLIEKHEGFSPTPYRDTTGHWTVGFGTNLSAGLSREEAELLLKWELKRDIEEARKIFPEWESLPEPVRLAIVDMIYNLGVAGFLQFKKMIEAIHRRDWEEAARQMEDSLWCRQVKTRCKELAQMVREVAQLSPEELAFEGIPKNSG